MLSEMTVGIDWLVVKCRVTPPASRMIWSASPPSTVVATETTFWLVIGMTTGLGPQLNPTEATAHQRRVQRGLGAAAGGAVAMTTPAACTVPAMAGASSASQAHWNARRGFKLMTDDRMPAGRA